MVLPVGPGRTCAHATGSRVRQLSRNGAPVLGWSGSSANMETLPPLFKHCHRAWKATGLWPQSRATSPAWGADEDQDYKYWEADGPRAWEAVKAQDTSAQIEGQHDLSGGGGGGRQSGP